MVGNVLLCFTSNVIERHAFGAQENVSSTPTDHRPTLVASQLPSGQAPPPDGWDFLQCLGRGAVPAGATLLVLKCGQLIKQQRQQNPQTLWVKQSSLPACLAKALPLTLERQHLPFPDEPPEFKGVSKGHVDSKGRARVTGNLTTSVLS